MVSAKCRLERSGLLKLGLRHAVSIFCVNYFPIMLFKNMRKKNSNDVREVHIPTVVQYLAGCRYLHSSQTPTKSNTFPHSFFSSDKIITGSGMHTWFQDKENKKKVKPFVLKAHSSIAITNHHQSLQQIVISRQALGLPTPEILNSNTWSKHGIHKYQVIL